MTKVNYKTFSFEVPDDRLKNSLLIAVSGSHSFGWATDKSDLDVRMVFCQNLPQMASPFYKVGTQSWYENKGVEGQEIDIVAYPIDHFLLLLNKGNGNILDNLFEPHIWQESKGVKDLQEIVKEYLHRGFVEHCLGYSIHVRKDFFNPTRVGKAGITKLLLERYREVLKGRLLCEGKVEYSLPTMMEHIKTKYASDVLGCHFEGKELSKDLLANAIEETDKLDKELKELFDVSGLPTEYNCSLTIHLDRWFRHKYFGVSHQEQQYNKKK